MRLNIHEMKQAAQLVLDWHCYWLLDWRMAVGRTGGRVLNGVKLWRQTVVSAQ